MREFKIGDRVKITSSDHILTGKLGIIKDVYGNNSHYTIDLDDYVEGCWPDEKLKINKGHGWNIGKEQIELFEDEIKKVKCINNDDMEEQLLLEKVYEVYHETDSCYWINNNEKGAYYKYRFVIIKDDVKLKSINPKINKCLIKKYQLIAEDIKIINNGNATIVILKDGTKGISKCDPSYDTYDADRGFNIAMNRAVIKKLQKELKELCK